MCSASCLPSSATGRACWAGRDVDPRPPRSSRRPRPRSHESEGGAETREELKRRFARMSKPIVREPDYCGSRVIQAKASSIRLLPHVIVSTAEPSLLQL
jgi:hypothetical protein